MIKQDIDVTFDSITGLRDIAIGDDGDLQAIDDFSTSIDLSILTDRRASSNEVPVAALRRGWIGDLAPRIVDFRVGSKVWLFEQRRLDADTINGIRNAVQESLEWLITGGQVERTEVQAVANGISGVRVTVFFFIGNNVVKRYFILWNDTEERDL